MIEDNAMIYGRRKTSSGFKTAIDDDYVDGDDGYGDNDDDDKRDSGVEYD